MLSVKREERMTTIGVVDPSALIREALASLLSPMGFDRVIGAATVEELQRLGNGRAAPDILLINLSGGADRSPGDLMRQIRAVLPKTRVVFLASKLDIEVLKTCIAAGASGYLISGDALQESLKLVNAGGTAFPAELTSLLSNLSPKRDEAVDSSMDLNDARLTEREIQILRLLATGHSNKRIAQRLQITDSTVKVHIGRILRKIHVTNRTQAALWAMARGLTLMILVSMGEFLGGAATDRDALCRPLPGLQWIMAAHPNGDGPIWGGACWNKAWTD